MEDRQKEVEAVAKVERYELWAAALLLVVPLVRLVQTGPLFALHPLRLSALWTVILLGGVTLLPQTHIRANRSVRAMLWGNALSGAILYVALGVGLAVLLQELSASPYDHSPTGILSNLLQLLPPLAAREYIRAYVLGAARRKRRHVPLWAVTVTLVMALGELNFERMALLRDGEDWMIFLARDALPLLTGSVLLTTLSFHGGPGAPLTYTAIIRVFQRVFPFLPSLPWIAESALGLAYPILFAEVVKGKVAQLNGAAPRAERGEGSTLGYAAGLAVAVAFCWFAVGVFPVYPSVVLTGSMEPMIYPGDTVLIQKVTTEEEFYRLQEGDVITFGRENITITHRIVEILTDEAGNRSFRTKGDNNDDADEEIVLPNDVRGLVTQVVPKVGLPVLILKGGGDIPEGVIG